MKKVCILLLFIGTVLASHSLLAQTKTPYQKQIEAVTRKFFKGLGLRDVYIDHIIKTGSSDDIRSLPEVRNQMAWLAHSPNGKMIIMALYSELAEGLKEAAKLKTDVDFKREAEEKRKEEKKAEEEKRKALYDKSDYVQIRSKIKDAYSAWLKGWLEKGGFENQDSYQKRIAKTSPQIFDSICYDIVTSRLKENISTWRLLEYNAETEKFEVIVSNEDGLRIIEDSLYVPLKDASKFKKDAENGRVSRVPAANYLFVNNNLSPTCFIFYKKKDNGEWEYLAGLFPSNKQNTKSVSFSTTGLGINLPKGAGFQFNFNDYYSAKVFKEKNGSAINNLAWNNLLSKNFSKALEILEKGLPLFNETDKTYPYLLEYLAHAYLFTNQVEKARKIYFGGYTFTINGKSWEDAFLEDFNTFEKRGIQSNDMEKIKQEILSHKREEERKREEKKREEERKRKLSVYEGCSLLPCPEDRKSSCRELVESDPNAVLSKNKVFIESCAGCTGSVSIDIHINEAGEVIGYQPVDTADFNKFKSVLVPQMEALKKVLRFNEIKKRKRSRVDHRRVVFEFSR